MSLETKAAGAVAEPLLLVGRWEAASSAHQQQALGAVDRAWSMVGWPDGMTAHAALGADDAVTVVNLSWWRDRAAVSGFTGAMKSRWWSQVEGAVPGLKRLAVHAYSRFGGRVMGAGETGCLVLVDVAADDTTAATSWMEAMLDLGRTEPPAAGMLSAAFYLDLTGTRVLNIAEWTSVEAHDAFVGAERSEASRALVSRTSGARPVGFVRSTRWRERIG